MNAEVLKQIESGFEVQVKNATSQIHKTFVLPTSHLSDFNTIAEELLLHIKPGYIVQDCVVVSLKPKSIGMFVRIC